MVVAQALRDAGFDVVLGGMLRAGDIARMAGDEDVQIIGLNVGGRIEVVHRILDTLDEAGLGDIPVLVGGTIPPQAIDDLASRGVSVHPPGSPLTEIVDAANRLLGRVG